MERDTEADRATVAGAAGLSDLHGGTARATLYYRAECTKGQGLTLSLTRVWGKEQGDPPSDMFIVCPVCGEEHTLVRRMDLTPPSG